MGVTLARVLPCPRSDLTSNCVPGDVLNNYQIKWVAASLMLLDHVGAIFFPGIAIFRILGRFSFPCFILLLVDGEAHTRNVSQYCLRLLLLGVASQPLFWLVFRSPQGNILFVLSLGLVCLRLVRRFSQGRLVIWSLAAAIAQLLHLEYGAYGVLAIALIRHLRAEVSWWAGWIGLHFGLVLLAPGFASFQLAAIFAPLLLGLANHQQGKKARWFYLFYPLHLLALGLLSQII